MEGQVLSDVKPSKGEISVLVLDLHGDGALDLSLGDGDTVLVTCVTPEYLVGVDEVECEATRLWPSTCSPVDT